jgi:hypothetical protein
MRHVSLRLFFALVALAVALPAWSQTCENRDDIAEQTRTALEGSAQRIFEQASRGDVETVRSNTISSFQSAIVGVVNDNKDTLAGARAQLRTSFLLETGASPTPDGRFYCGVFGASGMSSGGAAFSLPGLQPGKYGVVIQDLLGNKGPYALTTIFQELGGWKLAGFQIRPESAFGHDGIWYLKQARDYKSKGQNHNAWFYYLESWELLAPVQFMETTLLAKIAQELNDVMPKDVPPPGKTVSYSANGKTYTITEMGIFSTEKSFDLSIKYSVSSTADFAATAAEARNLANAYVSQHAELKEAFNNIWAHAIDPNGGDVPGVVTLKK